MGSIPTLVRWVFIDGISVFFLFVRLQVLPFADVWPYFSQKTFLQKLSLIIAETHILHEPSSIRPSFCPHNRCSWNSTSPSPTHMYTAVLSYSSPWPCPLVVSFLSRNLPLTSCGSIPALLRIGEILVAFCRCITYICCTYYHWFINKLYIEKFSSHPFNLRRFPFSSFRTSIPRLPAFSTIAAHLFPSIPNHLII